MHSCRVPHDGVILDYIVPVTYVVPALWLIASVFVLTRVRRI